MILYYPDNVKRFIPVMLNIHQKRGIIQKHF